MKRLFAALLALALCSCSIKRMYCEKTSGLVIKDIVIFALEIGVNDYPEGGVCVNVEED